MIANGLWYHLSGNMFNFPFTKRIESFQTTGRIIDSLEIAGFIDLEVKKVKHFIVTARKRLESFSE